MSKGTEKKQNLSHLIRRQPWIGGPGSRLPFAVESLLGWGLAISCLSVACYHYIRQMVASSTTLALPSSSSQIEGSSNNRWKKGHSHQQTTTSRSRSRSRKRRINSPILPLTTHSRKEILAKTTLERYQQLHQYLRKLDPSMKSPKDWSQEDELVTLIRSNIVLRRLVSLFMVKQQQAPTNTGEESIMDWIRVLTDIWPKLVQLPLDEDDESRYDYDISVIVPAYRESGHQLFRKLQEAHDHLILTSNSNSTSTTTTTTTTTTSIEGNNTNDDCTVEVVIVHAHCTDMESSLKDSKSKMPKFAKITCTPDVGGGRGPCLNHGAKVAKGRILTFLHADTRLAVGWNQAILQALCPASAAASAASFKSSSDDNSPPKRVANACAFSFAIDTSTIRINVDKKGNHKDNRDDYFPPGIRAVERTANWRSKWFHLPYGDQCLSVPSYVFGYVGGYPHQCLMEDYELVRLLRQRVSSMPEELKILDLPARCHVRRWQKFGVLYVTMTNSKLVNLYSRQHMTADELFAIYYGMDPEGKNDPIPWEVELEEFLNKR